MSCLLFALLRLGMLLPAAAVSAVTCARAGVEGARDRCAPRRCAEVSRSLARCSRSIEAEGSAGAVAVSSITHMRVAVSTRTWLVLAVLAALVSCGILWAGGARGATRLRTARFGSSPGDHLYKVPAGVRRITVTAVGAAGGNCLPGHGGKGAAITATVPVRPGEVLLVGVGGFGKGCNIVPASGGFGGGGAGGAGNTSRGSPGAGGGGASFVIPRSSSRNFRTALVVAGGGGGSTDFSSTVGVNGGNAGSPGPPGVMAGGGRAGSQSAGGAGGAAGSANAHAGFPGSLGHGGAGGHGATSGVSVGGGGGGGGYFGGGGGGGGASLLNPGGGGGGSSHVVAGATHVTGPRATSGFPEVIITPR
jgi:hypothetical protein